MDNTKIIDMVYGMHSFSTQSDSHNIAYELNGNCYINLTNRCTLRCEFCPKFNKQWDVKGYHLRLKSEPNIPQVLAAVGEPAMYKEIVFCGLGEPTRRLYEMLDLASQFKRQGATIRINTDGLANAVYARDITPLFKGCIDALSVSLNAHNTQRYNQHCRPRIDNAFNAVLAFARAAREHVPDITLTAIAGLNGVDIPACEDIATSLGVKFRCRILDKVG